MDLHGQPEAEEEQPDFRGGIFRIVEAVLLAIVTIGLQFALIIFCIMAYRAVTT